jgi:hypothetical protein
VNVKEKACPDGRFPELKSPLSAVTVWVAVSRFVNVTRVPMRTLRAAGLKAKFMIRTDVTIGGGAVGGVVGRGVETIGCGVGASVATGVVVGDAVGDTVGLATAVCADGDWDGGDWLVV